ALKQLLGKAGPLQEIAGECSTTLWRDIRDCAPFADGGARPVWRVSMAPSQAHHMVMALRMQAAVEAFYDWQGGLVWL
ncbi:2-hydroxy-acid oxidase, partial [Mesorhizobium sp. M2D.F.Ca.ET.140.01.1.1]